MIRVGVGDQVKVRLPYSEVCMHMRVAGQVRTVWVLAEGAQLLNEDGSLFSFPITHGEAGVYHDADGLYVIGREDTCPSSSQSVATIVRPT